MTTQANRAITLYRSLLKAHKRHLSVQMKQIGDKYVQSEFKLHKSVTNPEQIAAFMNGWEEYLENILQTARAQEYAEIVQDEKKGPTFEFGADLAPDTELSEEQKVQLEKLREEASRITK